MRDGWEMIEETETGPQYQGNVHTNRLSHLIKFNLNSVYECMRFNVNKNFA